MCARFKVSEGRGRRRDTHLSISVNHSVLGKMVHMVWEKVIIVDRKKRENEKIIPLCLNQSNRLSLYR